MEPLKSLTRRPPPGSLQGGNAPLGHSLQWIEQRPQVIWVTSQTPEVCTSKGMRHTNWTGCKLRRRYLSSPVVQKPMVPHVTQVVRHVSKIKTLF